MSFNEWQTITLEKVCSKITDGSHYSPKGIEDGYPMFTVKDMRDYGFNYSSCKRISKSDFEQMVRNDCVPQKDDVLIAKDGSYLKHVFTVEESKEEAVLSSIAIFRPNQDIITSNYLKYFIINPVTKKLISDNYVSGSAIPRIVLKDFKKIEVKLPNLLEQKAIAHILSTLDEKIEVNNKINKILENMAQAIFKEWFVDFEFPNEDGEPYKSSGGEMVESEFGMIPKGWEIKKVEDLCDVCSSKRIFANEYVDHGIPFYRGKEIIEKSKGNSITTELFITNEKYVEIREKYPVPKEGDMLLTSVGTLGIPYLVADEEFYFKDGNLTWFRDYLKNGYREYIFLWIQSKNGMEVIDSITIGSTQKALTISVLKKIKLVMCDDVLLEKFHKMSKSVLDKIHFNNKEKESLILIRDTLLPKLMSGEIRVPFESEGDAS